MLKINHIKKGSVTIEMSFIMPMIFTILIALIYLSMYQYNVTALEKAAYQGALRGSRMEQASQKEIKNSVYNEVSKLLDHKLPGIEKAEYKVSVNLLQVKVSCSITQNIPFGRLLELLGIPNKWNYTASKSVNRLHPVTYIRMNRQFKTKGKEINGGGV